MKLTKPPARASFWLLAGYLLGLFFEREYGASLLVWNIGEVVQGDTALHSRRWCSWCLVLFPSSCHSLSLASRNTRDVHCVRYSLQNSKCSFTQIHRRTDELVELAIASTCVSMREFLPGISQEIFMFFRIPRKISWEIGKTGKKYCSV
jgi:hypothetical protein